MPVKKNIMAEKECSSGAHCCSHGGSMRKILVTFVGVLLVYAIVLLGTMIRNNMKQYVFIGKAPRQEHTMSIQAEGKITVIPDIAIVNVGMVQDGKTVDEAQSKNSEVMNSLIAKLQEIGVNKNDIQTANYNIYPQYKYSEEEGSVLTGYTVNQSVSVKIRDLTKISEVLSLSGKAGANSISGPTFQIDDTQKYKNEARNKALEKVKEDMIQLSKTLGISFKDVISYNEYESSGFKGVAYDSAGMGMGGGSGVPTIEPGNQDVVLSVNVLFEIQ